MSVQYQPGQRVVYVRTKRTTKPGPRAKNVHPAAYGDTYAYQVEKFWMVDSVREDGSVVLRTRTGKEHVVAASDHCLRPATWLEKWWYSSKFPPKK